jgi:xylitol oxidase
VQERNWAGNYRYRARALHRPRTLEHLRELAATRPRIRVLGSRHSFTEIADGDELVTLAGLPQELTFNRAEGTVTLSAAWRYGDLAERLHAEGLALGNLASLPHISVPGAVATATHGSGNANGNLATAVAAVEFVRSDGELMWLHRGDADFNGAVVSLGALGAVTRISLDVQPAYEMRQLVFEGLAWPALYEHFDAIMAAGYSVSIFTRWQDTVDQVWVKQRRQPDDPAGDPAGHTSSTLFGARAATVARHPILGIDPVHCTPQLGAWGPWLERLPHFRMGYTPSSGDELQSEYHFARERGVAAIEAVRALSERLAELVQVAEIRTVAADELWLSPQYRRDTVAIHFTWVGREEPVRRALAALEAALLPLGARPHWGKLFAADAAYIASAYERAGEFAALAQRLDPRGAFTNAWLQDRLLAGLR